MAMAGGPPAAGVPIGVGDVTGGPEEAGATLGELVAIEDGVAGLGVGPPHPMTAKATRIATMDRRIDADASGDGTGRSPSVFGC